MKAIPALAGVLALAAMSPAQAALISYSDRAAFDAATAALGASTTEGFQSYATDFVISNDPDAPTSFTGFSAYYSGSTGGNGLTFQAVDVAPFMHFLQPSNSSYLFAVAANDGNPFNGFGSRTYMTLAAGTRAMGFDFGQWGDGANDTELIVTTTLRSYALNPAAGEAGGGLWGFLGFATSSASEEILAMTWVPIAGSQAVDGIGVDDVTVVSRATVPEPGSLVLAASGIVVAGLRRRRR